MFQFYLKGQSPFAALFIAAVCSATPSAHAGTGKFFEPQPDQIVAKVSGQDVLGRDIVPQSTLKPGGRNPASKNTQNLRLSIMQGYTTALTEKIWAGLRERIVLEHKIKATSQEISGFINASSRGKKLSPQARLALASKAEGEILKWKADYSLFLKYGGRLAKQGERVFPAEAQLKYLKELEAQGDFEIIHHELKDLFYAQYQEPQAQLIEAGLENPFESPWWLKKGSL